MDQPPDSVTRGVTTLRGRYGAVWRPTFLRDEATDSLAVFFVAKVRTRSVSRRKTEIKSRSGLVGRRGETALQNAKLAKFRVGFRTLQTAHTGYHRFCVAADTSRAVLLCFSQNKLKIFISAVLTRFPLKPQAGWTRIWSNIESLVFFKTI